MTLLASHRNCSRLTVCIFRFEHGGTASQMINTSPLRAHTNDRHDGINILPPKKVRILNSLHILTNTCTQTADTLRKVQL